MKGFQVNSAVARSIESSPSNILRSYPSLHDDWLMNMLISTHPHGFATDLLPRPKPHIQHPPPSTDVAHSFILSSQAHRSISSNLVRISLQDPALEFHSALRIPCSLVAVTLSPSHWLRHHTRLPIASSITKTLHSTDAAANKHTLV
jgi:hypothetical protein